MGRHGNEILVSWVNRWRDRYAQGLRLPVYHQISAIIKRMVTDEYDRVIRTLLDVPERAGDGVLQCGTASFPLGGNANLRVPRLFPPHQCRVPDCVTKTSFFYCPTHYPCIERVSSEPWTTDDIAEFMCTVELLETLTSSTENPDPRQTHKAVLLLYDYVTLNFADMHDALQWAFLPPTFTGWTRADCSALLDSLANDVSLAETGLGIARRGMFQAVTHDINTRLRVAYGDDVVMNGGEMADMYDNAKDGMDCAENAVEFARQRAVQTYRSVLPAILIAFEREIVLEYRRIASTWPEFGVRYAFMIDSQGEYPPTVTPLNLRTDH